MQQSEWGRQQVLGLGLVKQFRETQDLRATWMRSEIIQFIKQKVVKNDGGVGPELVDDKILLFCNLMQGCSRQGQLRSKAAIPSTEACASR